MNGDKRLRKIYSHIKSRCYNPKDNRYSIYGARGITVCKEWLNTERVVRTTKGWLSFKSWALSNGYADNLSIDRIDVNKGYSPDNCRWVSSKVQGNNRRSNHLITYKGEVHNLKEWCEILGLDYDRTERRINKCHWSIEKSFETERQNSEKMIFYHGKTQSLTVWCNELGLNYKTVQARLNKCHWSVEKAFEYK